MGLLFTGTTLGPTLGSLIIRSTHSNISVFYMSTAIHFVFGILTCFVVPDSLLPIQKAISRRRHSEKSLSGRRAGLMPLLKRVFGFLTPLALLAPIRVSDPTHPHKAAARDWSLVLIALSYGPVSALLVRARGNELLHR